jgi:hypothetical protein
MGRERTREGRAGADRQRDRGGREGGDVSLSLVRCLPGRWNGNFHISLLFRILFLSMVLGTFWADVSSSLVNLVCRGVEELSSKKYKPRSHVRFSVF